MKILQYNVQSLACNRNNLDIFANNNEIDICVLCETFSFKYIEKPRSDGYGGVAIFFKSAIKMKIINYKSHFDVLIAETTNLNNNIIICAVYFPQRIPIDEFNEEIKKILTVLNDKHNVFFVGDFKARHHEYGDYFDCNRGKNLTKAIRKSNFVCLNDGSHTFKEDLQAQRGSVLDLSFAIHSLPVSWEVLDIPLGGSHHFPILINIMSIKQQDELFLCKKKLLKALKNPCK